MSSLSVLIWIILFFRRRDVYKNMSTVKLIVIMIIIIITLITIIYDHKHRFLGSRWYLAMKRCESTACVPIDVRCRQDEAQTVVWPLASVQGREEWPPWSVVVTIPAPEDLPLPFAWHRPPLQGAVSLPGRLLAVWV